MTPSTPVIASAARQSMPPANLLTWLISGLILMQRGARALKTPLQKFESFGHNQA